MNIIKQLLLEMLLIKTPRCDHCGGEVETKVVNYVCINCLEEGV